MPNEGGFPAFETPLPVGILGASFFDVSEESLQVVTV
jgi:hypothetical protein